MQDGDANLSRSLSNPHHCHKGETDAHLLPLPRTDRKTRVSEGEEDVTIHLKQKHSGQTPVIPDHQFPLVRSLEGIPVVSHPQEDVPLGKRV